MADIPMGAHAPRTVGSYDLSTYDFDAALTPDQVQTYEAKQNSTWGVSRRLALFTLTRTKVDLVRSFGADEAGTDVLLEMIQEVQEWTAHLKASVELAEAASARLLVTCSTILATTE